MSDEIDLPRGVVFGWIADPLSVQLDVMNVDYDPVDCEHWQKDHDAISRLRSRGVITNSAGDCAYAQLAKTMLANLKARASIQKGLPA